MSITTNGDRIGDQMFYPPISDHQHTFDFDSFVSFQNTGAIEALAENACAVRAQFGGNFENAGSVIAQGIASDAKAFDLANPGAGLGLLNTGLIKALGKAGSEETYAIGVTGHSDWGIWIENSGKIISNGYAYIERDVSGSGADVFSWLSNAGLIRGAVALAGGDDQLHNSGRIIGDVDLGAGADFYDGGDGGHRGKIIGGDGNDWIIGGHGGQTIYGDGLSDSAGAGSDLIFGGMNGDRIFGGGGDDSLIGGGGRDILSGGAGADLFAFNQLSEMSLRHPDFITDVEASDTIRVSGFDADTTRAGVQHFQMVDAFDHHGGEAMVAYDKDGRGHLYLDVDGDAVSDAQIIWSGDQSFTNFNFLY
jgi:Ca2+-binding RTX toxin-like protein